MNSIDFEVRNGEEFSRTSDEALLNLAAQNIDRFRLHVSTIINEDPDIKCKGMFSEILESVNKVPLVDHVKYALVANDNNKMGQLRDGINELVEMAKCASNKLSADDLRIFDDFISFYLRKLGMENERKFPNVETARLLLQLAAMGDLADSQVSDNFNPLINTLRGLIEEVESKRHVLYEKRLQLVKRDEYGFVDAELWTDERIKFATRCVLHVTGRSADENELMQAMRLMIVLNYIPTCLSEMNVPEQATLVGECVSDAHSTTEAEAGECSSLESAYDRGLGFESKCSELFQQHGWSSVATAKTGDRGVDLVLTKRGLRVAVQCKNWASKVGSAAIQEIYSGARLYQADFCVVVSATQPTLQAKEMADELNVVVVLIDDIPFLEVIILKKLMSRG